MKIVELESHEHWVIGKVYDEKHGQGLPDEWGVIVGFDSKENLNLKGCKLRAYAPAYKLKNEWDMDEETYQNKIEKYEKNRCCMLCDSDHSRAVERA